MNNLLRSLRFFLWLLFILLAIVSKAQHLRSVMANACSGGGSEGENEYAILFNDSLPLAIDGQHIDFRYGNSFPASVTHTDSFWANGNAGFVNALNTYLNGSCDFSFVNGTTSDSIPVNSYFFIMYRAPTDTIDYSAWCGQGIGDVYVLFSKDQSWSRSGNFVNTPSSTRYFRTNLNGTVENYNYTNGWTSNKDGNYITWNDTGAAQQYLNYSNCKPNNLTALPVQIISISMVEGAIFNELHWRTASEINNEGFFVEYLKNEEWMSIGFVPGAGTSDLTNSYEFILPKNDLTSWYRLKQIDFDGGLSYSKPVRSAAKKSMKLYWNSGLNEVSIYMPSFYILDISVTDQLGRISSLIPQFDESRWYASTRHLKKGMYFVSVRTQNDLIVRRIWVLN
jgi:hypothetical protein